MRFTLTSLALLATAGLVSAQTSAGQPPSGCSTSYADTFEITVSLPMKKRELEARQATCSSGALVAKLNNGVLTDAKGRIGGIVANHQFQFDGPPSQAGTIYNSGWSVCQNGSLALGPSAIFYQCLSGTFYNLYNAPAAASCEAVIITVIPCGAAGAASQAGDGQPTVSSAVSQASEGQVQASSAGPAGVTQITDGQIQASSAAKPVSQYTDGQIQVTASPVKVTPVTQISDGQIQATASSSAAPVSEASEGQPQVTSSSKAPVSEASEGQPQVTSSSQAPASQASGSQGQGTTSAAPASQASTNSTKGSSFASSFPSTPSTPNTATTTASASPTSFSGLAPAVTAGTQAVLALAGFAAIALL